MSEQELLLANQEVFAALNAHDLERFAALLDPAVVWESDTLPNRITSREAARDIMQRFYRAFPDLHFGVEQELASGNVVITRWQASGRQQGEFLGLAPTHRPIELHGCSITEFVAGQVVQQWTYWDTGCLLQQLGVFVGHHRIPQQTL